jgi:branched-chain amino acid transport system ATP-binding protein
VLLVDHNVKSVAALVDRVLAMYLGEEIADRPRRRGDANETVRRVYLGGAIETSARPRNQLQGQGAAAAGRERQRLLRQGAGAGKRLDPCPRGRVRLGRRPQRRRQDHAVQTISGFLPYTGEIVRGGEKLRGTSPARSPAAASCNARNRASCSAR